MTGNTVQNLSISLTVPFNSSRFYWLLFALLDPEHHCSACGQTWSQWIIWILNSNVDSKMQVNNVLRPLEEQVALAVRVFHICKSLASVVHLSCNSKAMSHTHLEKENLVFLALD